MDFSLLKQQEGIEDFDPEKRAAPRYISLIRAAKLILPQGEFVCVVRDVSRGGVKVKLFHPLPARCDHPVLELQNGERFAMELLRRGEDEAGFAFREPVEVDRLIREHWAYPKRQFRLCLTMPVTLREPAAAWPGIITNVSQQGARVTCEAHLARDQMLRVEAPGLPELCAKIRWRRSGTYGMVFENTFRLAEIARLAARAQCPELLRRE